MQIVPDLSSCLTGMWVGWKSYAHDADIYIKIAFLPEVCMLAWLKHMEWNTGMSLRMHEGAALPCPKTVTTMRLTCYGSLHGAIATHVAADDLSKHLSCSSSCNWVAQG